MLLLLMHCNRLYASVDPAVGQTCFRWISLPSLYFETVVQLRHATELLMTIKDSHTLRAIVFNPSSVTCQEELVIVERLSISHLASRVRSELHCSSQGSRSTRRQEFQIVFAAGDRKS